MVKFLAYGWSSQRSRPSLRDQVDAALASAKHAGWSGLARGQREYLDSYWRRADVELEGDAALQQAVRFALFHTLQAGARAERRAIPAKGLTGTGYDGHTFWDMETFVLPGPHLHGPRRRRRRAALAPVGARPRPRAGARDRPSRGRVPVAHDPRPGVLRLLARGHGRLPRERGGGGRRPPVHVGDRRRGVRARRGPRAARGDRPDVALARPPRRARDVPDRRRDGPGRVHRDHRQQRLHQPDGRPEPRGGGRRRQRATRTRPPPWT